MENDLYRIFENSKFNHKYYLRTFKGAGNFGAVFLADELVGDTKIQEVAIKAIRKDKMASENIANELTTAIQLNHPHLINCITSEEGQLQHSTFKYPCFGLVMEIASGTLENHLQTKVLGADEVRGIVQAIASGLAYLHSESITHRDLKPANVLRVNNDWKISDFGIARKMGSESGTLTTSLTGTPIYMPPEVYEAQKENAAVKVSPAWDMWSLGVMIVEMLTGELPFNGLADILQMKIKIKGNLPAPFDEIVSGCLCESTTQRLTAHQVLNLLNTPINKQATTRSSRTISTPTPIRSQNLPTSGQTSPVSPARNHRPNINRYTVIQSLRTEFQRIIPFGGLAILGVITFFLYLQFRSSSPNKSTTKALENQSEVSKQQKTSEATPISSKSPLVIQPQFDEAGSFSEGLALVKIGLSYGYVDKTGNLVIKPQFDEVENFSGGLALVKIHNTQKTKGKYGYIDKTGKWVIQPNFGGRQYGAGSFLEGLAPLEIVWDGFKIAYGYIDKTGKFAIQPQFYKADNFSEGLAKVKLNTTDKYGYIDKTGKLAIQSQFYNAGNFSDGLASVQYYFPGLYGYIDRTGKLVIQPQFSQVGSFSEGLLPIEINGSYGYVDKSGKLVIQPQFRKAGSFSEGLASVQSNIGGPYGYVDKTGKLVIQPQFSQAGKFSEGLAPVEISDGKNRSYGYIHNPLKP